MCMNGALVVGLLLLSNYVCVSPLCVAGEESIYDMCARGIE